MTQEILKLALDGITKMPTLTHGVLVKLADVEAAIKEALTQEQEQEPVQVSPLEFVEMVMEKEHLIGNPIFWAEWPNKEKNT